MDDAPLSQAEVKNLQFLRRLVTVLTATMILGLLTIVTLLVIRFTSPTSEIPLPEVITLPEGANALAFTQGRGWFAVVTDQDQILIFDNQGGAPSQVVAIEARP
ncbi:MAG: DUF6476 family protein [Paracoccaceae bacterium]|nr:DUF6476 family protein [Paracoccaceae bacterium]